MAFLQADQDVAVLGADRAGVGIGEVQPAEGQADIVHDGPKLVRRDDLADRLLHMVELRRRLLDPGAGGARGRAG